MIKQKKKTCKSCEKQQYIFSKGRCKRCWALDQKSKSSKKSGKKKRSIKFSSNTNTYADSKGNRYTKQEIDQKVREAKQLKKDRFSKKHGYYFCERCGKSNCLPLDLSHLISVKEAQESGNTELAWDVRNLEFHGRECHLEFENQSKKDREKHYLRKLVMQK